MICLGQSDEDNRRVFGTYLSFSLCFPFLLRLFLGGIFLGGVFLGSVFLGGVLLGGGAGDFWCLVGRYMVL